MRTAKMNLSTFSIYPILLLCLSLLVVNGERKLSQHDCQCGVFLVKPGTNGTLIFPWVIYVHLKVSSSETVTCKGTVIASNVILTSRKCLTKEGNITNAADITVTSDPILGSGTSFPVIGVLQKETCSKAMGIQVDFDFTANVSPNKPVCLPAPDELQGSSLVGRQVRYESSKSGSLSYLEVKKAQDCDSDGFLKIGSGGVKEVAYCVTIDDTKADLEEGQPLYMEVMKNPLSTYGGIYGHYFYLVGVSTFVRVESEGRRHVFFAPTNTILKAIESIAGNSSTTTWCPQPWSWLKAPEKLKRDESLDCECGLLREEAAPNQNQSEALVARIAGGATAVPYEFPWTLKVYPYKEIDGEFVPVLCAGSLINDRMILTSASCIITEARERNASFGYDVVDPLQDYTIYFNSHTLSRDPEQLVVRPRRVILHPGYVDGSRRGANASFENSIVEMNIALIILDKPMNFTELWRDGRQRRHIPICLPKYGEHVEVVNKEGIIAGWGVTDPYPVDAEQAEELQKLTLTIRDLKSCTNQYQNVTNIDANRVFIHKTVLCAGKDLEKNANDYDSGGPFIVETSKGKYVQVGASSHLENVSNSDGDGIGKSIFYSDLQDSNILPWIDYYSNWHKAKYCKSKNAAAPNLKG